MPALQVIGGTTPGRDHFPYPDVVADYTTVGGFTTPGDGTFFPLTSNITNHCRWYYIVKKWRLAVAFNSSELNPAPPPDYITPAYSFQFDFECKRNDGVNYQALTEEADVCYGCAGFQDTVFDMDPGPPTDAASQPLLITNFSKSGIPDFWNLEFGFNCRYLRFYSGAIYAYMYFSLTNTAGLQVTNLGTLGTALPALTVDGISVAMRQNNAGGAPGDGAQVSSFTASITAIEEWTF